MDPYLEEHWGDLRLRSLVYMTKELNRVMAQDLVAEVDEYTALHRPKFPLRYVRILTIPDNSVITIIDMMNPRKMRSDHSIAHTAWRDDIVAAGGNHVEICLTREGDWQSHVKAGLPEAASRCPYAVLIRTGCQAGRMELYPIRLEDRLPAIPIPLRQREAPEAIDLQTIIDSVYVDGRRDKLINYARDCQAPLEGAQAAWADRLLREAGKR